MEYSNLKPIRLIIQCFNDILDIFFNLIFFSNLRVAPALLKIIKKCDAARMRQQRKTLIGNTQRW